MESLTKGKVINWLIRILAIAFLASTVWTYHSVRPKPLEDQKDIKITILPQYQVTSGKDLTIWPAGTALDPGMAAYFYSMAPIVTLTPVVEITGSMQGNLNGTLNIRSQLQAINDKDKIYWSYPFSDRIEQSFSLVYGEDHEQINLAETSNIDQSKEVKLERNQTKFISEGLTLDVNEANSLLAQISEELMFHNAIFQLVITTSVNLEGTVDEIILDRTIVQEIPLELEPVSFTIPDPSTVASQITVDENRNQASETRITNVVEENILQVSITLFLFFLLVILWMIKNRASTRTMIEHRRYKEWITEGSVELRDRFIIYIHTLEGLVDLAIDLDKRVIYDSKIIKYYVLTEDLVYVYDPSRSKALLDNKQQLGKLLLERELIQPEQLELGLYYQKQIGKRLGESLIALGFIDETTLYSTLASQQGLDYYELDTKAEIHFTSWLDQMSIQTARAFMALPLGTRPDGSMVIASSEASKEGIKEALQEIFKTEIIMVATKPSVIYEALTRIDYRINQETERPLAINNMEDLSYHELLTEQEKDHFLTSYYRGRIIPELLIKASGLVPSSILLKIPEDEKVLNWLVNKNLIPIELSNLITGLDKMIKEMDWKSRQENKVPDLLELLLVANYLTSKTVEWARHEVLLQKVSTEQFLIDNFLASQDTIKHANFLIETLKKVLNTNSI